MSVAGLKRWLPGLRATVIGIPYLWLLLFFAVIFIIAATSIRIVSPYQKGVVERLGRFHHTAQPGLIFVVPFIDTMRKVDMREQVVDVQPQEVITKDNATVTVDGVAFFQVFDAAKASYEVANLELALLNLIMTNIRTVMGSMDLDMLLSHRDEINQRLLGVVDQAVEPWGVKANRIEIKDITPPRDLVDAMAKQMKAEREKRANILEAEGLRDRVILVVGGPRISHELAKELGYDAGFGVKSYAEDVASFAINEWINRQAA